VTAIFADVLADFEAKRLAGAERTASREKRIGHPILPCRFFQDALHSLLIGAWLLLIFHHGRVNNFLIPRPQRVLASGLLLCY